MCLQLFFKIMGQQDKRQAFFVCEFYLIPTTTVLHVKHTAASAATSTAHVSSSPTPTTTAKSSYRSSIR